VRLLTSTRHYLPFSFKLGSPGRTEHTRSMPDLNLDQWSNLRGNQQPRFSQKTRRGGSRPTSLSCRSYWERSSARQSIKQQSRQRGLSAAALPCPPYVPFSGIVRVVGTNDRASVWSDNVRIARRLHDRRQSFWNGRRASEAGAVRAAVMALTKIGPNRAWRVRPGPVRAFEQRRYSRCRRQYFGSPAIIS
jgi:hypothetical protein